MAILALACAAMLCGYRSYGAISEWGRSYGSGLLELLGFTNGRSPCASTLSYLLRRLDLDTLEARLSAWAESVLAALPPADEDLEAIAIDGKTLRGSRHQGARHTHLLSALSHRLGLTLGQVAVAEKNNEITAIYELLRCLILEGRVITLDAMFTQRHIAQEVIEAGGDYLMVVKANQQELYDDLSFLLQPELPWEEKRAHTSTLNLSHGRIEERRLTVMDLPKTYLIDWPGAQQIMKIERKTTMKKSGRHRQDVAYAITSLPAETANPDRLLALVRGHWGIENRSFWVRDVSLGEDLSQVRTGNTPQVLAALRNTVVSLLRLANAKNLAAEFRRLAAQPTLALSLIGIAP